MDNHGAISSNSAIVYVMVKHNANATISSGSIDQQQQTVMLVAYKKNLSKLLMSCAQTY
jgi:hypothetical protein